MSEVLEAGGQIRVARGGHAVLVYSQQELSLALFVDAEARCTYTGRAGIVDPFTRVAVAEVDVLPGCMTTVASNSPTQWYRNALVSDRVPAGRRGGQGWGGGRSECPSHGRS